MQQTARTRTPRAFSTIELIAVVVMISALAVIGLFAYQHVVENSRKAAAHAAADQFGRNAQDVANRNLTVVSKLADDKKVELRKDTNDVDATVSWAAAGTNGGVEVAVEKYGYCTPVRFPGNTSKMIVGETIKGSDCAQDGVITTEPGGPQDPPTANESLPCPADVTVSGPVDRANIDWSPVTGATRYTIWRGTSNTALTIVNAPTTQYIDTSAPAGGTTYRIQPENAQASNPDCRAVSYAPALSTPNLEGAIDGTGATRAVLTWTVPAAEAALAEQFTIRYRPASPVAPFAGTGTWDIVNVSGATRTWTHTAAPGTTWEYNLTARSNRVGDSASTTPFALTQAPTGDLISGGYARDYGQNAINLNKPEGIVRLQVQRPAAGSVAASTTTHTYPAGAAQVEIVDTITAGGVSANSADQKALGYTWGYQARAENTGPRSGDGTAGAAAQTAITRNGPWSSTRNVLQFPADPTAVCVVGSNAACGLAAADGANRINFSAGRGSTTSEIWRTYTASDAEGEILTASDVVATHTSRTDSSAMVERGTKLLYKPVAVNATGKSPNSMRANNWSAAYQRPTAPVVTYRNAAQRPTPAAANATFQWGYTQGARVGDNDNTPTGYIASSTEQPFHPEANQPASAPYCNTTPSSEDYCTYWVNRSDTAGSFTHLGNVNYRSAGSRALTLNDFNSGTATNVTLRACNTGGCADGGTVSVQTFPGWFRPTNSLRSHGSGSSELGHNNEGTGGHMDEFVGRYDFDRGLSSNGWSQYDIRPQALHTTHQYRANTNEKYVTGQTNTRSALKMAWSTSSGAQVYEYAYYSENDAVNYSTSGRSEAGNSTWTHTGNSSAGGPADIVTPGARVTYTVRARSPQGLFRYWVTDASNENKFRAARQRVRLNGMTATSTHPGMSVQVPAITPRDFENKALCRVTGSGPTKNDDEGWGSLVQWRDEVVDGGQSSPYSSKVDRLHLRVGMGQGGSSYSHGELLDWAITHGYSTNTDSSSSTAYTNRTGSLSVMTFSGWSPSTRNKLNNKGSVENFGTDWYAGRVYGLPYQTGAIAAWTIRTHATPAASGQASTPADYGFGWSVASLYADSQTSNNNYVSCPNSVQPDGQAYAGTSWRQVNGESYTYNAGQTWRNAS